MTDAAYAPPAPDPGLGPAPWPTITPAFIRRDEAIRLTSYNAVASVTLTLKSRVCNFVGRIVDSSDTHTPNTDRSAKTSIIRTDEGAILDGQVSLSGAAPQKGQCFVVVELGRGEGGAFTPTRVLAAGYVTAKQPLLFPALSIAGSLDGQGALRSITGSTPAAGADISESVPTGARWMLLSFEADLVTAAAVANRVPTLAIGDGVNVYERVSINQNETASATWRNCWAQGTTQIADTTDKIITAPIGVGIMVPAGGKIQTSTFGLQGADQWTAPQYLVAEWIEGA